MNDWRPIATAPRDGTQILLWAPRDHLPERGYMKVGHFQSDNEGGIYDQEGWSDGSYDDYAVGPSWNPMDATHWMPLPKEPQP